MPTAHTAAAPAPAHPSPLPRALRLRHGWAAAAAPTSAATVWAVAVSLVLLAGCAPPSPSDPDAASADATTANDASPSDDAVGAASAPDATAPDALAAAPPLPKSPVIEDFERMCALAVEARRAGKMGDDKLWAVAEAFEQQGQTEQVKRLLGTMLNVPVTNRCLLLQTGARRAELEDAQLCTALCPMIRYEEAALRDVKLPVSSSDIWSTPSPQWTLIANTTAVRLGKLPIVPAFEGSVDAAFKDGHVIRAVSVLRALDKPAPSATPGVARLIVDAQARASLVLDLIATLQAEGATRFELMLQGGGKVGEVSPTVEAAQLSDDAILLVSGRTDAPPAQPRAQVWIDDFGVLITTFAPDGTPTQALDPACQRTVCALEGDHPIARIHWLSLYNALLTARDALGPDPRPLEVAASDGLTVEVLTKLADVARYRLTAAPGTPPQPIPADATDALLRWQPVKDPQGNPAPLFATLTLTPPAEVTFPPLPQVQGLQVQGLPPEASPILTPESHHLRACFNKHGKGLASATRPFMVMTTLTLATDGRVTDTRLLEMSTATGVVPADLQACLADRFARLRFPTIPSPLRFLMVFDP